MNYKQLPAARILYPKTAAHATVYCKYCLLNFIQGAFPLPEGIYAVLFRLVLEVGVVVGVILGAAA